MSIEYVFERFCEIVSDQVEKKEILKEWNKHSFCFHILTSGGRKGEMCEKRCVRDTFYCKAHAANVFHPDEKPINEEEVVTENESVDEESESADKEEKSADEDSEAADTEERESTDDDSMVDEEVDTEEESVDAEEEEEVKSDL
jgi:hypothetical protein